MRDAHGGGGTGDFLVDIGLDDSDLVLAQLLFQQVAANGPFQDFNAVTADALSTLVMVLGRIIELDDRANAHGALLMLRERQRSLHLPNPALLPRAVLYWTAGEAIRRVIDPEHRHVGETRGIYQRALRRFLPALEQYWTPYLDGGLSLDEALNGMIRLVAES